MDVNSHNKFVFMNYKRLNSQAFNVVDNVRHSDLNSTLHNAQKVQFVLKLG